MVLRGGEGRGRRPSWGGSGTRSVNFSLYGCKRWLRRQDKMLVKCWSRALTPLCVTQSASWSERHSSSRIIVAAGDVFLTTRRWTSDIRLFVEHTVKIFGKYLIWELQNQFTAACTELAPCTLRHRFEPRPPHDIFFIKTDHFVLYRFALFFCLLVSQLHV